MSLFSIFDVAGSGLAAQSTRLNLTASNLANADSVSSSVDRTYRARHPVFSAVMANEASSDSSVLRHHGARVDVVDVVESGAPVRAEYRPEHPQADADGYIFHTNVNVVEEMANMMSASRSYQSNLEVMNAAKQMLLRTLSLGQ